MNAALLLPMLALTTPLPPAPAPHGGHRQAEQEHRFHVARAPAEAFVFFEPVGEKCWAADWQPSFASAADAALHAGSVFTVRRPGYGPVPVTTVWTILRYEPPTLIEYYNFIPEVRTTRVTVRCAPAKDGTTDVTVRYDYHSLSAAGDAALAELTAASFAAMIDSWGTEIAAYLRRGTPASR